MNVIRKEDETWGISGVGVSNPFFYHPLSFSFFLSLSLSFFFLKKKICVKYLPYVPEVNIVIRTTTIPSPHMIQFACSCILLHIARLPFHILIILPPLGIPIQP